MHKSIFLLGVLALAGCTESPATNKPVSGTNTGQSYSLLVPNMT